jgi:hypothetical protein
MAIFIRRLHLLPRSRRRPAPSCVAFVRDDHAGRTPCADHGDGQNGMRRAARFGVKPSHFSSFPENAFPMNGHPASVPRANNADSVIDQSTL